MGVYAGAKKKIDSSWLRIKFTINIGKSMHNWEVMIFTFSYLLKALPKERNYILFFMLEFIDANSIYNKSRLSIKWARNWT